jgi:hypothetical protein
LYFSFILISPALGVVCFVKEDAAFQGVYFFDFCLIRERALRLPQMAAHSPTMSTSLMWLLEFGALQLSA